MLSLTRRRCNWSARGGDVAEETSREKKREKKYTVAYYSHPRRKRRENSFKYLTFHFFFDMRRCWKKSYFRALCLFVRVFVRLRCLFCWGGVVCLFVFFWISFSSFFFFFRLSSFFLSVFLRLLFFFPCLSCFFSPFFFFAAPWLIGMVIRLLSCPVCAALCVLLVCPVLPNLGRRRLCTPTPLARSRWSLRRLLTTASTSRWENHS